ncbi:MAG: GNAT family N-acetyltransferase [Planctomycetaceae bacterium]|nr:GNAT family N-acetyltransferase [Planctomycetaceae bacterium]
MASIERIRKTAERMHLVHATADHAQLLYDIFTGPNTQKYSPVSKTSVAELAMRLRHSGGVLSEHAQFYRFFGEYNTVLFGTFVVKNIVWDRLEAEIGFSLLDAWQGMGLGTALVYKCIAKVFAESPIEQIWATVSVTNEACRHLMESLRFKDCGLYEKLFLINGTPTPQNLYTMNRQQVIKTTLVPV